MHRSPSIVHYFLFLALVLQHSIPLFAQQSTASSQVSTFTMDAPQLQGTKKIWLYLPKGYENSTQNYPVIYMHDGQNLFDKATSYIEEWSVDELLDSLSAPVIVVGIAHGGDKRIAELSPYPNAKYGGGQGDAYLDFIVHTLKPKIDASYRTKSNAKNTCIMGSSLGGLVSFYAALKYPTVFGKVGCFSPAFWFNRDPLNEYMKSIEKFDTKIYFMCGDSEGDDDVIKDLNTVEYWVNTKRCYCLKHNKKVIVKGGKHNEKLWREQFKKAYLWLF